MRTQYALTAALLVSLFMGSVEALSRPVTIEDQGSFMAGGVTITAPGVYKDSRKILGTPNAANSPEWVYVAFPAGTYNRWHSQKTGQVLIATDGIGYHQIKGGALEVLHPGDVVFCPPNVVHWHGASPTSKFAHIAISPQDNHDVTWYDFPTAEYEAIVPE